MTEAAQPKDEPEESALSPWWLRSVVVVMVLGFAGLLAITALAYRNAPPIPGRVTDGSDVTIFTGDDISNGQALFQRYGLMDNGTIWGHGAYLGPDYSAEPLHRIGDDTAMALAQQQYGKPVGDLRRNDGRLRHAAIALMVFVLRQTTDDTRWPGVEKYIKVGFWGTNIGLFMMVVLSLFPGGVLQVWDVAQHGY